MGWIYIFFNLINHKVYIGKWQGKRVETRRDQHKNGKGNQHLCNAITIYGWENFIFDTLYENIPKEMLNYLEMREIALFDCNEYAGGWGYNQTWGGDGIDSESASAINRRRVEDGTHPFLGGDIQRETQRKRIEDGTHPFLGGEIQRKNNLKRVEDGTHPFLGGDIQRETQRKRIEDGTHTFLGGEIQRKRVEDGTHPFLGGEIQRKNNLKRVEDGTNPFLGGEIQRKNNLKRVEDGTNPFLRENNPRSRPEYMQARWEFFLSYPLGIKAARKQLFEKFGNVPQKTIYRWVREWHSEIGAV